MKTLNEQILSLIDKELTEVATRDGAFYGTIEFQAVRSHAGTEIEWASYFGGRVHSKPTLESAMAEIRRLRDPQLAVTVAKEKLAAAQKEVQAIEVKIQELSQNQTQTV